MVQRGFAAFAANSTDARATGAEARIRRRLDNTTTERDNDRVALGGKTKLPDGTLSYEVNYGLATLDANSRRYQFETASAALRRNIDWTVDRQDPQFPRVTFVNRATGENSLFRTQDMALNQLRFHYVTSDDEDLVAKLDYDFDQNVGSLPIKWRVGAKYRGKERDLDGSIDDYVPSGTAPLQSAFTGNYEPRNAFEGSVATFGPFPHLSDVFGFYNQN